MVFVANTISLVFDSYDLVFISQGIDLRWQKLQLLSSKIKNFLDEKETFTRVPLFLVWIGTIFFCITYYYLHYYDCVDSDAIVLDFGLNVKSLVEEVESSSGAANIIASSDIRMGLINTGVLIVRVNNWTRLR